MDKLDARYVDEGYAICNVSHKEKWASYGMGIDMMDREAIEQIAPCLKTKVIPIARGKYTIRKMGKEAKATLDKLPRTKMRRDKDNVVFDRCKRLWEKGYTDSML